MIWGLPLTEVNFNWTRLLTVPKLYLDFEPTSIRWECLAVIKASHPENRQADANSLWHGATSIRVDGFEEVVEES